MTFNKQLKKFNPTLYQIHRWILDAKKLGFGSMEFEIKTHDYVSKVITMKAVEPKDKKLQKSITKRIMVKKEKGKEENDK